MSSRVFVMQQGISLVEVALYIALLSGYLIIAIPASSRLLSGLSSQAERSLLRTRMHVLDLRLAKFFACGPVSELTELRVRTSCMDHTEELAYGSEGVLLLTRSSETEAHQLTMRGVVEPWEGGEPLFNAVAGDGSVQIQFLYGGLPFTRTYYAPTQLSN